MPHAPRSSPLRLVLLAALVAAARAQEADAAALATPLRGWLAARGTDGAFPAYAAHRDAVLGEAELASLVVHRDVDAAMEHFPQRALTAELAERFFAAAAALRTRGAVHLALPWLLLLERHDAEDLRAAVAVAEAWSSEGAFDAAEAARAWTRLGSLLRGRQLDARQDPQQGKDERLRQLAQWMPEVVSFEGGKGLLWLRDLAPSLGERTAAGPLPPLHLRRQCRAGIEQQFEAAVRAGDNDAAERCADRLLRLEPGLAHRVLAAAVQCSIGGGGSVSMLKDFARDWEAASPARREEAVVRLRRLGVLPADAGAPRLEALVQGMVTGERRLPQFASVEKELRRLERRRADEQKRLDKNRDAVRYWTRIGEENERKKATARVKGPYLTAIAQANRKKAEAQSAADLNEQNLRDCDGELAALRAIREAVQAYRIAPE